MNTKDGAFPSTPPETLLGDPHLTVTLDRARRLVRYVRSKVPYSSLEEARLLHEQLGRTTFDDPSHSFKLLIDVRDAPPRNDEAFEAQLMQAMQTYIPRFSAFALLVKSAVGRLQAQRMARARGAKDAHVFDDESEALRYLGL
jgi:hypothetical protein